MRIVKINQTNCQKIDWQVKIVKINKIIKLVNHQLCKVSFILCHYKMATKQMNIKHKTYYFYNDMINNVNCEQKTSMGLDIYHIGYVDKKPQ